MKSKVVSGMSGLMLAFALILTGCDDGGGGDGGGSFSVTGAPVYTATSSGGGIYTISSVQYSGTGVEQPITGKSSKGGGSVSTVSIEIGFISMDGKLTLNLPANPPEEALIDAKEWLGVSAKLLILVTNPLVHLVKSDTRGQVALVYADQDDPGSNKFPALKKGWQYVTADNGSAATVITDPSAAGYKWVVVREN
ncbi:MAG: hypothetical protein LBD55_01490 [Treponema sp.]|nr:hypothetical protein [Treponema sp.]